MRVVLNPANAAFNATAGTITFSSTIPASLSHILFVANLTRGVVYFDPTNANGGGYLGTATYASPVLSLPGINTAEHANGDRLFIEYDDGTSGGGGGGGGGGSSNVTTTASPTDAIGNNTRQYDWINSQRTAIGSTTSAAVELPTLGASREVMFHSSSRCFVRMGTSTVIAATVAAGQMVLEAGERFHIRIPAGTTHYRVIRDTADGFLNVAAVL